MLEMFKGHRLSTLFQVQPFERATTDSGSVNQSNESGMGLGLAKVERTVRHSRSGQRIGRVKFEGVSWQALCLQDVPCMPGTLVEVKCRYKNTLIVDLPFCGLIIRQRQLLEH